MNLETSNRFRSRILGYAFLLVLGGISFAQAQGAREQGIALYKQRNYAQAKGVLWKAVSEDPKDALAKGYLAQALLFNDQDVDKAVELLEEAVRLDPNRALLQDWLGQAYANKVGNSVLKGAWYASKVKECFEKAVALEPKSVDAREFLMQFYLKAPGMAGGSVAKALEQAQAMKQLDRYAGLYAEGRIAEHQKDESKAEALYRQAIAVAPPNKGQACNLLGYILLRRKNYPEAIAMLQKYVQAEPTEPNAHDSLGEALLAAGRVDESLAEYQKALELDPRFSASYIGLGACHERKGNWKAAREAYQKCAEILPKGGYANMARKKLKEIQGKG